MYNTLLSFFTWLNDDFFALPAAILFSSSAIIITIVSGFFQVRYFPRFVRMLLSDVGIKKIKSQNIEKQTVGPFKALFAALATSIGMGNVVGPTVAILRGGPGALFWLVVYMIFASVTKYTEVFLAMSTRERMPDGHVVGGPMQYLKKVSPMLAYWYGGIMTLLFASLSGLQSNTLASIVSCESHLWANLIGPNSALQRLPEVLVGLFLAFMVFAVVRGGARRVSELASRLVPIMFVLYISFAFSVLFGDFHSVIRALKLVWASVFSHDAMFGGFLGVTVFDAIRFGVFRGIYISESGLGTSSIPHAMSDAQNPVDQGILAMGATVVDIILSMTSGLLVLVTNVWRYGEYRVTLVYEVFRASAPLIGQLILVASISLFILTTIIGNSFNGAQSFSSLTKRRWLGWYMFFTLSTIFISAVLPVKLVWEVMDTLMVFAAVPNILGILYLACKERKALYVHPR